jgi:Bacterial CdiA-CT RNAse A domain
VWARFSSVGILACIFCCAVGLLAGCQQPPASTPSSNHQTQDRPSTIARADRYDLSRDEQRGGHTLQRHIDRSAAQLQSRLEEEPNISAASTWTDRETAEVTIAEALHTERARIDRWVRRGYPRANLALHYDARRVIGSSIRRGERQSENCTNAVIVLRAAGPDNFYVLTAYPEARE